MRRWELTYFLRKNTESLKMGIRGIFIWIILCCSIGVSSADTVYLKNGNNVKGKIVEKADSYVKIDSLGLTLTYWLDEIERIETDTIDSGTIELYKNKVAVLRIIRNAAEYIEKGQLDKVEEIYREGLKEFPDNALLWASLAGSTLDQGRIDEAIEYCNRALSLDSCCAHAYFVLGLTSSKKGDEDKAIQKFREAIKCDPSFILAYYDLGISYISKQKYSEGIDMWVKATQLDKEGSVEKKIENAFNTYIQNASPSESEVRIIDSSRPWILLPSLKISQKKIFESLPLEYKTKLQIKEAPDFAYYLNLGGIMYHYRGDFDNSLEDIKMALNMLINNKDLPEERKQKYTNYAYRLLGDIYLHKLEIEIAAQNYQEALKFDSKDVNSLCGLGVVNTVRGDLDKAKEIYGKVLNLDPNSSFAQEALKLLENK